MLNLYIYIIYIYKKKEKKRKKKEKKKTGGGYRTHAYTREGLFLSFFVKKKKIMELKRTYTPLYFVNSTNFALFSLKIRLVFRGVYNSLNIRRL